MALWQENNDYYTCNAGAPVSSTDELTIAFWCRTSSSIAGSSPVLFALGNNAATAYLTIVRSSTNWRYIITGPNGTSNFIFDTYVEDKWQFFAFSRRDAILLPGTNRWDIRRNVRDEDTLDGTWDLNSTILSVGPSGGGTWERFDIAAYGGANDYYGDLFALKVWRKFLPINDLYNESVRMMPMDFRTDAEESGSLIGFWPLTGVTGNFSKVAYINGASSDVSFATVTNDPVESTREPYGIFFPPRSEPRLFTAVNRNVLAADTIFAELVGDVPIIGRGANALVCPANLELRAEPALVCTGANVQVASAALELRPYPVFVNRFGLVCAPTATIEFRADPATASSGTGVPVPHATIEVRADAVTASSGNGVPVPFTALELAATAAVVLIGTVVPVCHGSVELAAEPATVLPSASIHVPEARLELRADAAQATPGQSVQVPEATVELRATPGRVCIGTNIFVPSQTLDLDAEPVCVTASGGGGGSTDVDFRAPAASLEARAFPITVCLGRNVQVPFAETELRADVPLVCLGVNVQVAESVLELIADMVEVRLGRNVQVPSAFLELRATPGQACMGRNVQVSMGVLELAAEMARVCLGSNFFAPPLTLDLDSEPVGVDGNGFRSIVQGIDVTLTDPSFETTLEDNSNTVTLATTQFSVTVDENDSSVTLDDNDNSVTLDEGP